MSRTKDATDSYFQLTSAPVRIQLIAFVENMKDLLGPIVSSKLVNGITCEGLVGDSAARVFKLACGLGVIDKAVYDVLRALVRKRNDAAHNKAASLCLTDLPALGKVLPVDAMSRLYALEATVPGHQAALIEAIHRYVAQRCSAPDST